MPYSRALAARGRQAARGPEGGVIVIRELDSDARIRAVNVQVAGRRMKQGGMSRACGRRAPK